jgi:hypothetical protein
VGVTLEKITVERLGLLLLLLVLFSLTFLLVLFAFIFTLVFFILEACNNFLWDIPVSSTAKEFALYPMYGLHVRWCAESFDDGGTSEAILCVCVCVCVCMRERRGEGW